MKMSSSKYASFKSAMRSILASSCLVLGACSVGGSGATELGSSGSGPGAGAVGDPNTVFVDPNEVSGAGALSDYSLVIPPEWGVAFEPQSINIRNKRTLDNGPVLSILPPKVGSGDLEADMDAMFFPVFSAWQPPTEPDTIKYYEKGKTTQGFDYYMLRQAAKPRDPNGSQKGAYCSLLLVQLAGKVAMVAHREEDFSSAVQALSYLLFSLRFKQETPAQITLAQDIVGPWSLTTQFAAAVETFYSDGNFTKGGATSFTVGSSDGYGTITTTQFSSSGNYRFDGNRISQYFKSNDTTYLKAVRFYSSRVGDRPWRGHMATVTLDEGVKYQDPTESDSLK